MACSTDLNTCIAGWGGGSIYFTTNGGSSWTQATSSPTTPSASYWSWPGSNYIAKDWVTANKFYFISWSGSTGTIKVSTNGGQTWTSGGTFASTGYLNVIKTVPGQAGHLFVTAGARPDTGGASTIANLIAIHPVSTSPLYFSSNSGTTLTQVPGTQEAISMGFTAAAAGETYPAIRAIMWSGNTYGLYGCDNFNPSSVSSTTWTYLGVPLWADLPQDVSGDPNQYGRGAITKAGSGAEIYQVSGQPNTWP
jgi:hypothetical protein